MTISSNAVGVQDTLYHTGHVTAKCCLYHDTTHVSKTAPQHTHLHPISPSGVHAANVVVTDQVSGVGGGGVE